MLKTPMKLLRDDHNSCSNTEGQITAIGNTDLTSVAGWSLPDGRAREEKLVTVFNKFNPVLFAYNGAAEYYNSPSQSRNTY